MNILIYAHKRGFDVQKTERYFKERKIPYQYFDLNKRGLGPRELSAVMGQVGVRAMIDEASDIYKDRGIRYVTGEQALLDALAAHPKLLRVPIVRNGRFATVGYAPEVWAGWISNG
jgi:arsenate reductase-like glutaredoxin family protein